MNSFRKLLLIVALLAMQGSFLFAQNSDSLVAVINSATNDSDKFNARIKLVEIIQVDYLDSAFKEAKWCIDYADASGNKKQILHAYHNLGSVSLDLGDNAKALAAFVIALKAAEELGDKKVQSGLICNIGIVYSRRNSYDDAIASFRKALPLAKEASAFDNEANILFSLAGAFSGKGDRDSTLCYYSLAEKMFTISEDYSGLAVVYNNIGLIYLDSLKFDSALVFFNRAMEYSGIVSDDVNLSIDHNNIGDAFLGMNLPDSALIHFRHGMWYAKNSGAIDLVRDSYVGIAKASRAIGQLDSAYYFLDIAYGINDSVFNSDSEQKYADLKAGFDRDAKEKELLIKTLETEQANREKTIFRTLLVITGVFVIILVFVFVNRYKIKQRANSALAHKNAEIEEKSKSITDSIHYAKLIQQGLLPDATEIANRFPESFVLFQPKDIVSGDFYWTSETNDFFFLVTADCTGHGVPGGFMSVLGSSLLNEVILENKLTEPCEILDLLRVKIIRSLKQNASIDSGSRDGIDLVLCRYSRDFSQVTFAGAYNPLWVLRDSVITEYATNKQPVGLHIGELVQFTQQKINLRARDVVYTFTDGFADQFGGPKGKKFKYRQLQELLINNGNLPMNEQAVALEKAFNAWKGELEQIDDVLVIGVRV